MYVDNRQTSRPVVKTKDSNATEAEEKPVGLWFVNWPVFIVACKCLYVNEDVGVLSRYVSSSSHQLKVPFTSIFAQLSIFLLMCSNCIVSVCEISDLNFLPFLEGVESTCHESYHVFIV